MKSRNAVSQKESTISSLTEERDFLDTYYVCECVE